MERVDGELVLRTIRHHLDQQQVGSTMVTSARYDVTPDMFTDMLCHRLTAFVLSERVVRETHTLTIDVPATWFQHLKAARMRDWILRRWPVRYTTVKREVTFDKRLNYPAASIALPALGAPVVYETIENRGSTSWPRR